MLRIHALLFLSFLCIHYSSAGVKNDLNLLERLKRSPHYCPPWQSGPPPSSESYRQWPPGPPEPEPWHRWPPGPPPRWGHHHHHHHDGGYSEAKARASAASDAEAKSSSQAQAISAGNVQQSGNTGFNPPCATCGPGSGSSAVSNANSKTGNSIAVAVAKPN